MAISFEVEHRDKYSVVRVDGNPGLDEFVEFVKTLGTQSAGWSTRRLLVDMRGIRSLKTFTEHYAVGEAAARELAHLQRVASVVPPDRITRASEKTAQRAGFNLVVFISEGDAIAWLVAE